MLRQDTAYEARNRRALAGGSLATRRAEAAACKIARAADHPRQIVDSPGLRRLPSLSQERPYATPGEQPLVARIEPSSVSGTSGRARGDDGLGANVIFRTLRTNVLPGESGGYGNSLDAGFVTPAIAHANHKCLLGHHFRAERIEAEGPLPL